MHTTKNRDTLTRVELYVEASHLAARLDEYDADVARDICELALKFHGGANGYLSFLLPPRGRSARNLSDTASSNLTTLMGGANSTP